MPQIIRTPNFVPANGSKVTQAAHNFTVGEQVYLSIAGTWERAKADAESTLKMGTVADVISTDVFVICHYGLMDWPAHGYALGATYYLSDGVLGGVSASKPSVSTSYTQGAFQVEDADTVKVIDMLAVEVGSPLVLPTVEPGRVVWEAVSPVGDVNLELTKGFAVTNTPNVAAVAHLPVGVAGDEIGIGLLDDSGTGSIVLRSDTQNIEGGTGDQAIPVGSITNYAYIDDVTGWKITQQYGVTVNLTGAEMLASIETVPDLVADPLGGVFHEIPNSEDVAQIEVNKTDITDHIAATADAHDATAIAVDGTTLIGAPVETQDALEKIVNQVLSLVSGSRYLGLWDASTNTPTLSDATGSNSGDFYYADTPGTVDFGSGPITFRERDTVIYSGTQWELLATQDTVGSVFGRTGDILAVAGDYDASQVDFDNTGTGSTATDSQTAIEELFTDVGTNTTKLAGIEPGATADQTGAEMVIAIDAEADANIMTDAQVTKLGGIESGATADQTGAEMVTAIDAEADANIMTDAQVTKLAGVETGATADQTGAEIVTAIGNEPDANLLTDAQLASIGVTNEISWTVPAASTPLWHRIAETSGGSWGTLNEMFTIGMSEGSQSIGITFICNAFTRNGGSNALKPSIAVLSNGGFNPGCMPAIRIMALTSATANTQWAIDIQIADDDDSDNLDLVIKRLNVASSQDNLDLVAVPYFVDDAPAGETVAALQTNLAEVKTAFGKFRVQQDGSVTIQSDNGTDYALTVNDAGGFSTNGTTAQTDNDLITTNGKHWTTDSSNPDGGNGYILHTNKVTDSADDCLQEYHGLGSGREVWHRNCVGGTWDAEWIPLRGGDTNSPQQPWLVAYAVINPNDMSNTAGVMSYRGRGAWNMEVKNTTTDGLLKIDTGNSNHYQVNGKWTLKVFNQVVAMSNRVKSEFIIAGWGSGEFGIEHHSTAATGTVYIENYTGNDNGRIAFELWQNY